jgi:hypothetical protein
VIFYSAFASLCCWLAWKSNITPVETPFGSRQVASVEEQFRCRQPQIGPVLALEAFRRKSSTAKQLYAVMLYADKSSWVEIKFADLVQYCCMAGRIAGIEEHLSL